MRPRAGGCVNHFGVATHLTVATALEGRCRYDPRRTDKETGKVNVSPKLRRQVARPGSEVPRSRLGHRTGAAHTPWDPTRPHTHVGVRHTGVDPAQPPPRLNTRQARGAAPTPGSPPCPPKSASHPLPRKGRGPRDLGPGRRGGTCPRRQSRPNLQPPIDDRRHYCHPPLADPRDECGRVVNAGAVTVPLDLIPMKANVWPARCLEKRWRFHVLI